jgi:tryptophanyl-tRNA synthetase
MRILSGTQPGGALHIGNQIDTTMFFTRANQRKRAASGLPEVVRKKAQHITCLHETPM